MLRNPLDFLLLHGKDDPRVNRGSAPTHAGTVRVTLEGDLFVSLEQHPPVALELEGELSTESSFELEREREGRRFSGHSALCGPMSMFTVEEE